MKGREQGGAQLATIYCLNDWRFNFITFNEFLTRRDDNNNTKRRRDFRRSFHVCVCGARILFLHKRTTDQQAVAFFFFFFNFLYEGNSVGTTGSFEMIREKEPSSLSLSLSLDWECFYEFESSFSGPSVCFLLLRMCVLCILRQGRVKDHRRGRQSVSKEISYSSESPNANKK